MEDPDLTGILDMRHLSVLVLSLAFLSNLACGPGGESLRNHAGPFQYIWSETRSTPPGDDADWKTYTIGTRLDASGRLGQTIWFRTEPLPLTSDPGAAAFLFADASAIAGLYAVHMCDTTHRFGRMNYAGYTYYVRRVWPIVRLPAALPGSAATAVADGSETCRLYIASITGDGNDTRAIQKPLRFGDQDDLRTRFILSEADILFLGVIFLSIGLLTLPVVVYRADGALAGFSFFLISIGCFHFLRSDLAWYLSGMDNIRFWLLRSFLYMTPLGLLYFAARLFQGRAGRIMRGLTLLYAALFVALACIEMLTLARVSVLNPWRVLEVYLIAMLPLALVFTGVSFYGAASGDREQRLFAGGLFVFLLAVTFDLASRAGDLGTVSVTHWGLLSFVLILLYIMISRFFAIRRELELSNRELVATNLSLDRFVPRQFLEFLGRDTIADVRLGDQTERVMTVLFIDIRSFTSISERMTPRENFSFINGYLKLVGPIIRRHEGLIDKYIGDAVMALFDAGPDQAIRAVIEILSALDEFNAGRAARGEEPVRIGAGIHTGRLMLGTVGEVERMQTTVISDAVNLSARLESLTKPYGVSVLLSDAALESCEFAGSYRTRYLGRFAVKGKTRSVGVYELLEGSSEDMIADRLQSAAQFQRAIKLMAARDFGSAQELFQRILEEDPGDTAALHYREQCRKMLYSYL